MVAAAKTGQFDHVARRARDDRAEQAVYTQAAAQLEEQRVPVVDRPQWGDPKVREIDLLRQDGERLTAGAHADCPGRAAYIDVGRDWDTDQFEAEVTEVCTDYRAHGHTDPSDEWRTTSRKKTVDEMTDDVEVGACREERRRVIAHNKAWASCREATGVRRARLARWLTRKTPPKGTGGFVAAMLTRHSDLLTSHQVNGTAARLVDSVG